MKTTKNTTLCAMKQALAALSRIAESAGDVPEWNDGGYAREACRALRAEISKAQGIGDFLSQALNEGDGTYRP